MLIFFELSVAAIFKWNFLGAKLVEQWLLVQVDREPIPVHALFISDRLFILKGH